MMRIAAFDLATVTGCADGLPSGKPRCWTWRLGGPGEGRPLRLERLLRFTERYFAEAVPDAVFYERGIQMGAAWHIGMSDETVALLRGAIGILEAVASRAGVPRIEGVEVQRARKHFVGYGRIAAGEGKSKTFAMCKTLQWPVSNMDESDACAIWALGCSLANPRTAHLSTPLFA